MTDILIPAAVVEAAAKELHANAEIFPDILWDDLGEYDQDAYREEARAALIAGLSVWPGGEIVDKVEGNDVALLLPLPKEAGDE